MRRRGRERRRGRGAVSHRSRRPAQPSERLVALHVPLELAAGDRAALGVLRRVGDLVLGGVERDLLDGVVVVARDVERRHEHVGELDLQELDRGAARLARGQQAARDVLAGRDREHQRRRGLVRPLHEREVSEADLARAAAAADRASARLLEAPGEGLELDLALALAFRLARDAVQLEKVIDYSQRAASCVLAGREGNGDPRGAVATQAVHTLTCRVAACSACIAARAADDREGALAVGRVPGREQCPAAELQDVVLERHAHRLPANGDCTCVARPRNSPTTRPFASTSSPWTWKSSPSRGSCPNRLPGTDACQPRPSSVSACGFDGCGLCTAGAAPAAPAAAPTPAVPAAASRPPFRNLDRFQRLSFWVTCPPFRCCGVSTP